MDRKLTKKQLDFCHAYVETGNASEAYRRAYDASGMEQKTIIKRASELLGRGDIKGVVAKLRGDIHQAHGVTVASLMIELEEARQVALKTDKAGPMVQATMGKAKLAGLDRVVEEKSSDMGDVIRDLIAKLPG